MSAFWEGFEKQAMSPKADLATRIKSISIRTLSEGRPAQKLVREAQKVAPKAVRSVPVKNDNRLDYLKSLITSPSDWRKALASG